MVLLTKWWRSGTPSCHSASGRFLLLTFPLLIWDGSGFERPTWAGLQVSEFQKLLSPCLMPGKDGLYIPVLPAEVGTDTSMHQPCSFTSWTILSLGGKTSAGYTSRGFISRAKVKAIKYSIVIIIGKWKAPQLAREDADFRKLVFLSSFRHEQIKCSRWLREGAYLDSSDLPSDLVLPLSSGW